MKMSGNIVLVTGASRGLGRAAAEALGAAGAQVVAVARTVGGLEEADDAIRAAGGPGAVLVPLDITDGAGLARLGAAIHDRWGHLDLWIHTAIQGPMLTPVEHVEPEDMDRVLAVGVAATQHLIRVVDPLLRRADSGRAVFIEDAMAPSSFNGAYLAAKCAQRALAEAWGRGIEQASAVRILRATAPPMPTALRARWFPGEKSDLLTPPATVAARLVEALATSVTGEVDLTSGS